MLHLVICCLIAGFSVSPINDDGQSASQPGIPQEEAAVEVSGVVESGNRFSLDLYQQLRSEDGNLFFSPTSIVVALAMTWAGAEADTETEMAETLHFVMPEDQAHQQMQALISSWTAAADEDQGYQLNVANRLWGQANRGFLESFVNLTRDQYAAELARLDFRQSEEARHTINQWVEQQTGGRIVDLIPEGVIDAATVLVLTNAVYFKGTWAIPFKKEFTREGEFHLTPSETALVPLMNGTGRYGYGEFGDLKVLELLYGKGDLSMVVLLPDEIDGMADLEARMTLENMQHWTANLARQQVKVTLPRFKTTSEFQLNETLESMGMGSAFDARQADFSGMTGSRDLFIAAVVHKAFVDVNEEGTEAAAATGVVMGRSAVPRKPPEFRADHPFVFLIRDNRNGAILFMGRVVNPLDSAGG